MKYSEIECHKYKLLKYGDCGDPIKGIRQIDLENAAELIRKLEFVGCITDEFENPLRWKGEDFTLDIFATDSGLDHNDPHMEAHINFKEQP